VFHTQCAYVGPAIRGIHNPLPVDATTIAAMSAVGITLVGYEEIHAFEVHFLHSIYDHLLIIKYTQVIIVTTLP